MRSVWEEFRKNFALYAVFNVAGGMLTLVNMLEGTFARSLIACDVPLDAAPGAAFSGSAHCGDRLLVIDQGQKLSSAAEGYECLCKVLAMLFISVLANIIGRKPALVIGLSCTALSVLLFFLASFSPMVVASWLFMLGQALQGAFPAELLGAIVVTDIGNEPGANMIAIGSISQVIGVLVNFLVQGVATCLNYLELLDFRPVWASAALVNVAVALAAVALCRETKPDFGKPAGSLVEGVRQELSEYGTLLRGSFLLRMNLLMFAFVSMADMCDSVDFSFVIARHGFSQARAVLWFFFQPPVAVLCIGIVPVLSRTLGEKRTFVGLVYLLTVLDCVLTPCYPLSPWAVFAHKYFLCIFSGFGPLRSAIDQRWFDQRVTAKFLSMRFLVKYGIGMGGNPLYAALFSAKAESYLVSLRPYLLKLVCRFLQVFMLLRVCWDAGAEGGLSKVLDAIERDNAEARASKPQGETNEKKEE